MQRRQLQIILPPHSLIANVPEVQHCSVSQRFLKLLFQTVRLYPPQKVIWGRRWPLVIQSHAHFWCLFIIFRFTTHETGFADSGVADGSIGAAGPEPESPLEVAQGSKMLLSLWTSTLSPVLLLHLPQTQWPVRSCDAQTRWHANTHLSLVYFRQSELCPEMWILAQRLTSCLCFASLLDWQSLLKTDVTTFRSVVYSGALELASYVGPKFS